MTTDRLQADMESAFTHTALISSGMRQQTRIGHEGKSGNIWHSGQQNAGVMFKLLLFLPEL
jgi:hypothetical protein